MAIVFFSGMVMLGVFTKHPPTMSLCGGILTALLIYASVATRRLGRKAGAKTPWPVLAALATSSLLGTAIALAQI